MRHLLAASGKTAIFRSFCHDEFQTQYRPSLVMDFSIKSMVVDELDVFRIQVWDITNQTCYKNISKAYFRGARSILPVFSLNEPFNESTQTAYLKEIQELKPENTDIILVGNKTDIELKPTAHRRTITVMVL